MRYWPLGGVSWKARKLERTETFYKYRYGWRKRDCTACNGSGVYDVAGAPPCGACEGTGKEWYRGPKALSDDEVGILLEQMEEEL